LKRAINRGLIPGPRIMACGRDLGTTGDSVDLHPSWWKLQMQSVGRVCDGPEEFRKAVRDEIKQGVEIIKLYPNGGHGLPWPSSVMTMTLEEMKSAAETAHERGAKIPSEPSSPDSMPSSTSSIMATRWTMNASSVSRSREPL